jgi:hypothetical protein
MPEKYIRTTAENLANALGIAVYIRDGEIYQIGPGERVDPPKSAHPETHGRFTIAAAARP